MVELKMWLSLVKFVMGFVKNPLSLSTIGVIGALGVYLYMSVENSNLSKTLELKDLNITASEIIINNKDLVIKSLRRDIQLQNEGIQSLVVEREKLIQDIKKTKIEYEGRLAKLQVPNKDANCQDKVEYFEQIFKELSRAKVKKKD